MAAGPGEGEWRGNEKERTGGFVEDSGRDVEDFPSLCGLKLLGVAGGKLSKVPPEEGSVGHQRLITAERR